MSYYVGFGAKVIIREEFRFLIENYFDFEGSTDPILAAFDKLIDYESFKNYICYDEYSFDRESGLWDFKCEYNMNPGLEPFYAMNRFEKCLLPYITQEYLEASNFDEEEPAWKYYDQSFIEGMNSNLKDREKLIQFIHTELKDTDSYKEWKEHGCCFI